MSSPEKQSTQVDDDQLEDLVKQYSEFCELNSQAFYDEESQSIMVESQLDKTKAPTDYQAEFLKCIGIGEEDADTFIEKSKSYVEQLTQNEANSQTDLENAIKTFITDNPIFDATNKEPPKNVDIGTFLEGREWLTTIKMAETNQPQPQPEPQPKTTVSNTNETYNLGPLPLVIECILKIPMDQEDASLWSSDHRVYGRRFRTVMFYGLCTPKSMCAERENQNLHIYSVDDGSAAINVHFPHFSNRYSDLSREVDHLVDDFDHARREGIPFLGHDDCAPNTTKCKKALENINLLINLIKRNGAIKQQSFDFGTKVCVIGRVFLHKDGTNRVFAYHMYDLGDNCEYEIEFKTHLISVYEKKYLKYKINGEKRPTDINE